MLPAVERGSCDEASGVKADKILRARLTPRSVAFVTGGAQGIGRAIVQRLLRTMSVIVLDHDREACADLATHGRTGDLLVIRGDASQETTVRQAVRKGLKRYGRLDVLVNNAAISDPYAGKIEHLSMTRWNRVLAAGLTSAFVCVKHAIPALRRANGTIINLGSTRALQSEPQTEAYATTKGGIVALTHALAISLGPDIRVNCISPGWIAVEGWKKPSARKTPRLTRIDHAQHPAGRVGCPEDVAGMVAYLASEEARFITAQNFIIDGGMTHKMIYAP